MARTSINKLKLNKEAIKEVSSIKINEEDVTVRKYLPLNMKLKMIAEILELVLVESAAEGNEFYNPVKVDAFTSLKIIEYYTNINITEKQKEEIDKTYDLLDSNKIFDIIVNCIPKEEYEFLIDSIKEVIDSYYKYKNSAKGIMETIVEDYSNTSFDINKMVEQIKDPDGLPQLKEIIETLG